MTNEPSRTDATPSAIGFIYQACVALECCFEMREGQVVTIEKAGDVSIIDSKTLEVKCYTDQLTELHDNFWKSLRNWIDPGFDDTPYNALILMTTQSFGPRNRLSKWKELSSNDRLNLVLSIATKATTKQSKTIINKKATKPPETIRVNRSKKSYISRNIYQFFILDANHREKLERIVEKIHITTNYPDYKGLHNKLSDIYAKGINAGLKGKYINALLSFIIAPGTVNNSWSISYEDFCREVAEVQSLYQVQVRSLPRLHLDFEVDPSQVDASRLSNAIFVEKIRAINYDDAIPQAIEDYQLAKKTIEVTISERNLHHNLLRRYYSDLRNNFITRHQIAKTRNKRKTIDPCDFFDEIQSEASIPMDGGSTPTLGAKNGMIHDILDTDDQLHWRLD